MKRWTLLLALALLLSGCAAQTPPPTAATDTTAATEPVVTTEPTQAPIPEPLTIWTESLDREYLALASMGEDLLLFGDGVVSLYQDGAIAVTVEASIPLPDTGATVILEEGLAYYDAAGSALVTLDATLQETRRISLTEPITGEICLSPDGQQLYYCTTAGIRVWDAETWIHRTVKVMEGNWLGVIGTLGDGACLLCSLEQADGSIRTLAVSAANGETLFEGEELENITDSGDFYTCITDREWIFGYYGQQPQNLLLEEKAIPLPQRQMAVTLTQDSTGTELQLYDLNTGLKLARDDVAAKNLTSPAFWQDKLVFLSGNQLCFWDLLMSPVLKPVVDTTVYTTYRYTADAPDYAGLTTQQDRADDLSAQYGIDILLWTEVAEVQPAGYQFQVEYRAELYREALDTLETALARFPENFLRTAGSWTESGKLHIVLTRSAVTPEGVCPSQYLLGWDAYILLSMGDSLEQTFYHGLGHVVDTLVLSNSHGFYEWEKVNPSGFAYDGNYDVWQDRESKYLEGNKRYFINSFAMTFPVEDRATLLEYALLPDNEELFESKYLQAKLKRLKTGYREAFGLEGDTYPWEQYLK